MPWARLLSLAVLLISLTACSERQVQAARARDQAGMMQYGGLNRTYLVHVPPGPPSAWC